MHYVVVDRRVVVSRSDGAGNSRCAGHGCCHGAAIWGHIDVLKRLHDHGADVLGAVDSESKAPLDFAAYFCQAEAEAYLRSLGGEGYKTLYEQQNAAAVQIQKRARGSIGRRPPTGALFTTPDNGEVAAGYR